MPSPAILKNPDLFRFKNIGAIIAGGNVDLINYPGSQLQETNSEYAGGTRRIRSRL